MVKKAVTSDEAPQRRDTHRQIDQSFLELIHPKDAPVSAEPDREAVQPRARRAARKSVDGVELISPAKLSRARSPEDQNVTTFRGIPKSLNQSIRQFAVEIDFPIGIAARLLLELGLREYQQGHLTLVPHVSFKGLSLYPTAGNPVGRPKDPKKKKPSATTPAAYRGIPETVIAAIESIQQDVSVPKGEIARRLFEHSLSLYHQGKLEIPDPVSWLRGQVTLIQVKESPAETDDHV